MSQLITKKQKLYRGVLKRESEETLEVYYQVSSVFIEVQASLKPSKNVQLHLNHRYENSYHQVQTFSLNKICLGTADNNTEVLYSPLSVFPIDVLPKEKFDDLGYLEFSCKKESDISYEEKDNIQILNQQYYGINIQFEKIEENLKKEKLQKLENLFFNSPRRQEAEQTRFEAGFHKVYPIFEQDVTPVHECSTKITAVDLILSRTYSAHPQSTTFFFHEAIALIKANPFCYKIMTASVLSLAQEATMPVVRYCGITPPAGSLVADFSICTTTEPFKIVDPEGDSTLVDFSIIEEVSRKNSGHYSLKYNVLVINFHNISIVAHEFTHFAMEILFSNYARPYSSLNENMKKDWEIAVNESYANIAIRIGIPIKKSAWETFRSFLFIKETVEEVDSNSRTVSIKETVRETVKNLANTARILSLNEEEIKLFEHALTVPYCYPEDSFDTEAMAKFTEIHMDKDISTYTRLKYFHPLETYCKKYIFPQSEHMRAEHINNCEALKHGNGFSEIAGKTFEMCVTDFLEGN
jgi:hypothetical protein